MANERERGGGRRRRGGRKEEEREKESVMRFVVREVALSVR